MKNWLSTILVVGLIVILLLPQIQGSAQENLERVCSSSNLEAKSESLPREKYRSLLRECLDYYKEENKEIEGKISETRQRRQTLKNKIYSLSQRIRNLDNEIRQSKLVIEDLSFQIQDTEDSVEKTSIKIQESTRKLSEILRAVYEQNEKTTAEILLSEDKLSGFFDNLVALEVLSSRNRELLKDIKDLKGYLKQQREKLVGEKKGLEEMVAIQQSKRWQSRQVKQEKQRLKQMTEAEYQQYLAQKQETEQRIENISAKLWKTLVGVREVPKYGEAVKVAQGVEDRTGVRAAFLLGLLTQESRIGHNVGQCVLKDFDTGLGAKINTGKKWPRVMKPSRDVPPFRDIIRKLDQKKSSKSTLVSCWIPACYSQGDYSQATVDQQGDIHCAQNGYVPYGWGGAMGPAQFIPSTWDSYEERVSGMVGEPADPWNFSHAALAAGLLLKEGGADAQTRAAERQAAVRYLGADYLNYANNVLSLAECHQSYLDTGSMSASCQKRIGLK
ncbi:hypothetical protein AKJ56_00075 [candidate division MSBL1 archaeon SCGC-AAA382N08]|uniref:Transglycosylase SLT domain-containing protein n=1 Tax=candidate division MSBL1 archaeon SCGC-AAA382N08 TaxID=1698285 RepID=A0A133VQY9_9EURY|nr:hypothetical protein AKJ56_00075 [candidate division MSBL1 archaeon SCGC-AAA382N08]